MSIRVLAVFPAFAVLTVALPQVLRAPAGLAEEDEPAPPARKDEVKPRDESPAGQKLEAALQLRKSRKYDEATAVLREALTLSPPPPLACEILYRIGEVRFKKGQDAADEKLPGVTPEPLFAEAIKAFEEALKTYPTEEKAPEAAYLIGSSHLVLGDLRKALAAYQAVCDRYPKAEARSRAFLRTGVCHAGLDDAARAKAIFFRWLRDYPQDKDGTKVQKYLRELDLVGRKAPPLKTSEWLNRIVGPEGLAAFEGEVVVLLFFATWCENCSAELPHLRSLIRNWTPGGVVFLGVANPEDPKNTQPVDVYVQKNRMELTDVALDRTFASWDPYKVTGLPAAVVIDRKGRIRWRGHLAFFPGPILEKALAES